MRFCVYLQRNKDQNISKWEKRLIPDPITDFKKQFWRSSPLALPRVRNAFMSATLRTGTWLIYWHLNQDQLTFPTNAYLPANQGLLTPQLTPVWKPSNACLSSCKASLSCIRFICLNISALHSLPLSSPIPVAAGSSSQHRKKNLSSAAFISCGGERSEQMTSRGLKKPPLADSDGSGSDKDSCVILRSSGNVGSAILCCKMEEKSREIKFFKLKTSKRFCKPKYFP